MDKTPQSDVALAASHSRPSQKSGAKSYKNYEQTGHHFSKCPTIECRYCHGYGRIVTNYPIRLPKGETSKNKHLSRLVSSSIAAFATEGSSTFTMSDLEALLRQVISSSSPSPTTLSVNPGNSS